MEYWSFPPPSSNKNTLAWHTFCWHFLRRAAGKQGNFIAWQWIAGAGLRKDGTEMQAEQYQFQRFIRNKVTGQYLRQDGAWTTDLNEALEFEDALTMLDYCHLHSLARGIEVFLKPSTAGAAEVVADLF